MKLIDSDETAIREAESQHLDNDDAQSTSAQRRNTGDLCWPAGVEPID